ncbi:MAG: SDR family oxidoreductase [bacterium]
MEDQQQKKALITGTSNGIGLALAKKLLDEGYKVIGLSGNLSSISNTNYQHKLIDLSKNSHINSVYLDLVKQNVSLDFFYINNSFTSGLNSIDNINEDALEKSINFNFKSVFWFLKYFCNITKPNEGKIIVNISAESITGNPEKVLFCAAQSALFSIVQSFSKYLKEEKIKVIALYTGIINNDDLFVKSFVSGDEAKRTDTEENLVSEIFDIITNDEIPSGSRVFINHKTIEN